jgi:hypothetical protein
MIKEIKIVTPQEWVEVECPDLVSVDFETFYTSSYSVSELGHWAYTHDARFQAYLVAVSDGERTCVCVPGEFPWASIVRRSWVSHNRDFDRSVFERLQDLGQIPKDRIAPKEWHCTAVLCAFLQFPRDLAGAVKSVFDYTLDKAPRKKAKGVSPVSDELLAREMQLYAAQDAFWCLRLWNHLERHWSEPERKLFELTSEMGRHGLGLNWDYVRAKRKELEVLVESIANVLPWKPATSLKQFGEACERIGVVPPASTSNADPRFHRWIRKNIDSDAALWVRHMQRIRSANRTAKVLEAMEKRRMPNERMAYELKYFGASTGRWSGGGGLNLQNLNRKSAEGVDLRQAIIPPEGHVLGVLDYSQIENRVLLYLAGDTEALAQFRNNPDADAYEIHARRTMGYDREESLKDYCDQSGSNLRQLAKARVLGLGFGCGWRKFIEVARVMAGLELSENASKTVVEDFRRSNPLIVELWSRLHNACSARDGEHYALPLPCTQHNATLKRYLFYRDVCVRDKDIIVTVGGDRVKVYGGLIAENWTQATARDVLASAWIRCSQAGFVPELSVHDELVFELPQSTAEENLSTIISIMEQPLPWAPHLPLKVEGKLMDHYTK